MENDFTPPPQTPQQPQFTSPFEKPNLPNATAALVLGIVSIPTCFCYGVVGLICGIIAIIFGSKAVKTYELNEGVYSTASYKNAKAGKICGYIGLSLGLIYLILIVLILVVGIGGGVLEDYLKQAQG